MRFKKQSYDEERPRWVLYIYEWSSLHWRSSQTKQRQEWRARERARDRERERDSEEQRAVKRGTKLVARGNQRLCVWPFSDCDLLREIVIVRVKRVFFTYELRIYVWELMRYVQMSFMIRYSLNNDAMSKVHPDNKSLQIPMICY